MLTLLRSVRIFVATGPTDMRKGFDGPSALVSWLTPQDRLLVGTPAPRSQGRGRFRGRGGDKALTGGGAGGKTLRHALYAGDWSGRAVEVFERRVVRPMGDSDPELYSVGLTVTTIAAVSEAEAPTRAAWRFVTSEEWVDGALCVQPLWISGLNPFATAPAVRELPTALRPRGPDGPPRRCYQLVALDAERLSLRAAPEPVQTWVRCGGGDRPG